MYKLEEKDILVLSDDIRDASGFAVNGRMVTWAASHVGSVANASLQASKPATTEIHGRELDIYPCKDQQPQRTAMGQQKMQQLVNVCDPDVVISVIDIPMCDYLANLRLMRQGQVHIRDLGEPIIPQKAMETLKQTLMAVDTNQQFEWVAHLPIDGKPLPQEWEGIFKEMDHPIPMSDFGKEVLEEQYNISMPKIPHGVDYRKVGESDSDRFLLGTVNRNQFRKQYPRLIESWGKFYDRVGRPDDVEFYIHANYTDSMGWNLDRLLKKYDIEDAVKEYEGKVSREKLMSLYNQMDVFCSATGGEGFGLTTIEAMSQGTPVVITDYTTSRELIGENRGCLIPPAMMYDEHPQFASCERALVDTDRFAEVLEGYYNDRDKVRTQGENAKEWVLENLNWREVGNQWIEYLENEVERL